MEVWVKKTCPSFDFWLPHLSVVPKNQRIFRPRIFIRHTGTPYYSTLSNPNTHSPSIIIHHPTSGLFIRTSLWFPLLNSFLIASLPLILWVSFLFLFMKFCFVFSLISYYLFLLNRVLLVIHGVVFINFSWSMIFSAWLCFASNSWVVSLIPHVVFFCFAFSYSSDSWSWRHRDYKLYTGMAFSINILQLYGCFYLCMFPGFCVIDRIWHMIA